MATARAVGFGENIPEPTLLCLRKPSVSTCCLHLLLSETSVVPGELVLHWDRRNSLIGICP